MPAHADDYDIIELLARIRALHRRCGAEGLEILRCGPISEEVGRRTTLLGKVWDTHFDPESNVVDVHVGNPRRKLTRAAGEVLLGTARGVGFRLSRGDAS